MDVKGYLSPGMIPYYESKFESGRASVFYIILYSVGIVLINIYGLHWSALLLMSAPMVPLIGQLIGLDKEDAFFDDFGDDELDQFCKNYTKNVSSYLSEEVINSDIAVLVENWKMGVAEGTLASLTHMLTKLEILHDIHSIREEELSTVPGGYEDSRK